MLAGLSVAKTLIKYNSNSLTENDEEEKVPIVLSFALQKADPEMMKMLLTLDDQVHKKKKMILLWLTSLKITKVSWWGKIY